jgi:tRNA threonylcarbamoyladenosine biosynthesis protein TsaB
MALILLMETSTEVCSVGLAKDGKIIGIKENFEGNQHASQLHVLVDELLKETNYSLKNIDAVAISKGPGSYTGLRVGVSSAKGYCYGLDIPLIAIGTLESLKNQLLEKLLNESENYFIIPMLDARRMEVYCGIWNHLSEQIVDIEAKILDDTSFSDYISMSKTYFVGTGIEKFNKIISNENAVFMSDLYSSVIGMAAEAEQKFANNEFEDTAYFEPYYLKEFVGTIPKKALHKL